MKIGIVGTGLVGTAGASALILRGVASELVLIDKDARRAEAEAQDLRHSVPFAPNGCRIKAGCYADLGGAGVVVLTAGVNQKPGESRLDLLERNAQVFADIVPQVEAAAPEARLLVATNPVDVMTHVARRLSRQAPARVIGSGTILDTARFRDMLGYHLGVAPSSVHAYVLGEHGDSEVLHWSGARAGSLPIAQISAQRQRPITEAVRQHIDDAVRGAAGRIIAGKGATYFGIGAGLARICRAIASDEHAILTVAIETPEIQGVGPVTLSLPRLVAEEGVLATFPPAMDDGEAAALKQSAEIIKDALDRLGR